MCVTQCFKKLNSYKVDRFVSLSKIADRENIKTSKIGLHLPKGKNAIWIDKIKTVALGQDLDHGVC